MRLSRLAPPDRDTLGSLLEQSVPIDARGEALHQEKRSYRFITPLWGGGAVAHQYDVDTPVSGKGIRGQLRFWWRATRGGCYADLAELRSAEDAIWGATSRADQERSSRVQIRIEEVGKGTEPSLGFLAACRYGLFPLEPSNEQIRAAYPNWSRLSQTDRKAGREGLFEQNCLRALRADVTFTLILTYPTDEQTRLAVEAALWAWETFGGLGSRTRRGFGALQRIDENAALPSSTAHSDVVTWINESIQRFVAPGSWEGSMQDVPHLMPDQFQSRPQSPKHCGLKIATQGTGQSVQGALLQKLASFRQYRVPPPPDETVPGRSYWPDADAIRRLAKTHEPDHEPRSHVKKFPSAALGLPRQFHFAPTDAMDPGNTPAAKIRLAPGDSERWASPLLVRPLACGGKDWKEGKNCVGLALVIEATPIQDGLRLIIGSHTHKGVRHRLDVGDELLPQLATRLAGELDIVQAFLNFL